MSITFPAYGRATPSRRGSRSAIRLSNSRAVGLRGELASLYSLDLNLQPLPGPQAALLLDFAALLGWLGAWLSVGQYLRQNP